MSDSDQSDQQQQSSRKRSALLFSSQQSSDAAASQQLVLASNDKQQLEIHQDDENHPSKKRRMQQTAIVLRDEKNNQKIFTGIKRTSSLLAPIMQLEGHKGEIFSCKFRPKTGDVLATASFDRSILLWKTSGSCENFAQLKGHFAPVTEVCWTSDAAHLLSSSADKSVCLWDVQNQVKIAKYRPHTNKQSISNNKKNNNGIINCVATAAQGGSQFSDMILTGSDDSSAVVIDTRCYYYDTTIGNSSDDESDSANATKGIFMFDCEYPVLSVAMHSSNFQIFTAGIDNCVKVWDTRKGSSQVDPLYQLKGHLDSITGIKLSPCENFLLTNSMDNSLRVWDIRPFAKNDNRCIMQLYGHRHGFDKNLLRCTWSADGTRVSCGSSDSPTHVFVWDVSTASKQGTLTYKLPGHKGTVTETAFHPLEPIIASASADKTIFVGELTKE